MQRRTGICPKRCSKSNVTVTLLHSCYTKPRSLKRPDVDTNVSARYRPHEGSVSRLCARALVRASSRKSFFRAA